MSDAMTQQETWNAATAQARLCLAKTLLETIKQLADSGAPRATIITVLQERLQETIRIEQEWMKS